MTASTTPAAQIMMITRQRTPISLAATVSASNEQVSCEMGDEHVLLHMRQGVYYGLDEVGSYIWKNLQEAITVSALRDIILRDYEGNEDHVTSDLIGFLHQLDEWELIRIE